MAPARGGPMLRGRSRARPRRRGSPRPCGWSGSSLSRSSCLFPPGSSAYGHASPSVGKEGRCRRRHPGTSIGSARRRPPRPARGRTPVRAMDGMMRPCCTCGSSCRPREPTPRSRRCARSTGRATSCICTSRGRTRRRPPHRRGRADRRERGRRTAARAPHRTSGRGRARARGPHRGDAGRGRPDRILGCVGRRDRRRGSRRRGPRERAPVVDVPRVHGGRGSGWRVSASARIPRC